MQVDLNSLERRMCITALTINKGNFKEYIQEPKTPAAWRKTWKKLIEKLKQDEILHEEVRDSMGGNKKGIIPH